MRRSKLGPRSRARLVFTLVVFTLAVLEAGACTSAPVSGDDDALASHTLGSLPPATFTVATYAELSEALEKAKAGDIIHVDDAADIDVTGKPVLSLRGGVTLRSGRGIGESAGARIHSKDEGQKPLIEIAGPGATVSGLRLEGAVKSDQASKLAGVSKDEYYRVPFSQGVRSRHGETTIEYCEIFGFTHCAVCLGGEGNVVRHNYIHHNARHGIGYGVLVESGSASITKNVFDRNRHAIATPGSPGTSYVASENVTYRGTYGHDFDVHGGKDRGDGTNIAGKRFELHHNRYYSTVSRNFLIRGAPEDQVHVHDEIFAHATLEAAVGVTNVGGTSAPLDHPDVFTIGNNTFGVASPKGIPTDPDAYLPASLAPLPSR